jgi:hypothetical protein
MKIPLQDSSKNRGMRKTLQNKKKCPKTTGKVSVILPTVGHKPHVTAVHTTIMPASVTENRNPAGGFQFHQR